MFAHSHQLQDVRYRKHVDTVALQRAACAAGPTSAAINIKSATEQTSVRDCKRISLISGVSIS